MPSISWQELRRRAIRQAGIGESGTITTGGSTTFIDTTRQEPDNFWVGGYVWDTQNPASELVRRCTLFTRATSTFTYAPSATFALNDSYLVIRLLTPANIDEVVRDSFVACWRYLSIPAKSEQALTGAAFAVPLAPAIAQFGVYRVELQPWIAYADMPWPAIVGWRVFPDGSKVEFPPGLVWNYSGRSVRLWGYSPLPAPLDPTAFFTYAETGDEEMIIDHIAGGLLMLLGERSYVPAASGGEAQASPIRSGQSLKQQALARMAEKSKHLHAPSVESAWVEQGGERLPW